MLTNKKFRVTFPQGVRVRSSAEIAPSNILHILPAGNTFVAIEILKIGDRTWAKNNLYQFVNIANGQTFYVEEVTREPQPAG